MAALACTKTEEELPKLWEPGSLILDAFEKKTEGSFKRKIKRLRTKGKEE